MPRHLPSLVWCCCCCCCCCRKRTPLGLINSPSCVEFVSAELTESLSSATSDVQLVLSVSDPSSASLPTFCTQDANHMVQTHPNTAKLQTQINSFKYTKTSILLPAAHFQLCFVVFVKGIVSTWLIHSTGHYCFSCQDKMPWPLQWHFRTGLITLRGAWLEQKPLPGLLFSGNQRSRSLLLTMYDCS